MKVKKKILIKKIKNKKSHRRTLNLWMSADSSTNTKKSNKHHNFFEWSTLLVILVICGFFGRWGAAAIKIRGAW